jgi:hypothetical protein
MDERAGLLRASFVAPGGRALRIWSQARNAREERNNRGDGRKTEMETSRAVDAGGERIGKQNKWEKLRKEKEEKTYKGYYRPITIFANRRNYFAKRFIKRLQLL